MSAVGESRCAICNGPLDDEGMCGPCIGVVDERPTLAAGGTLDRAPSPTPVSVTRVASEGQRVVSPELPGTAPGYRGPASAPHGPGGPPGPEFDPGALFDPGGGNVPFRDDSRIELDESALAVVPLAGAVPVPPPVAEVEEENPASRRRRWPWILAILVVLLLGASVSLGGGARARRAVGAFFDRLFASSPEDSEAPRDDRDDGKRERSLPPGLAGEILMIDSVPSGARVYLGDELLGVTPVAIDSPYDDGESFEVVLKKAGYEPAVLQAKGGGPTHLEVKLKRR